MPLRPKLKIKSKNYETNFCGKLYAIVHKQIKTKNNK